MMKLTSSTFDTWKRFTSLAMTTYLLPGDLVAAERLPNSQKSLTLGPGLRYIPPTTIAAVGAGRLSVDDRKNALWLESNGSGRVGQAVVWLWYRIAYTVQYIPAMGDLVVGIVHHSSVDSYHCSITPYTAFAMLPQLAFEGASKKTRPVLQQGSLVYARVSLANKHMDPEIECVHPSTGKGEGLGELKGGMVFDISLGMARRLLMPKTREDGGVAVLEDLAERGLRFEVAVGRNGRIWIHSENVKTTLLIGKAVTETDSKALTLVEQTKLVTKLMKQSS